MQIAAFKKQLLEQAQAVNIQVMCGRVADQRADIEPKNLTIEQWMALMSHADPPILWMDEAVISEADPLIQWIYDGVVPPDHVQSLFDRLRPEERMQGEKLISQFRKVHQPRSPAIFTIGLAIHGLLYRCVLLEEWAVKAANWADELKQLLHQAQYSYQSEQRNSDRSAEHGQASALQEEVIAALATDTAFRSCSNIRQRQGVTRVFVDSYKDRPGFHMLVKRIAEIADTAYMKVKQG